MEERRKKHPPTDTESYLRQLSALAVLDRLPTAMLGVGLLGDMVYANAACADMLGYANGHALTRLPLPGLLTGHEVAAPAECVTTLRGHDSVITWNHSQGYLIRTMVSRPVLLRDADTILLVGVTDITPWLWETTKTATTAPSARTG